MSWGSLQKPKPYRNVTYMLWIKTHGCAACATLRPEDRYRAVAESAHTGQHALGSKASDFRCIPLCPEHHRGSYGLDTLGPERFEERFNLNLRELVLQYIELWLAQGNTL